MKTKLILIAGIIIIVSAGKTFAQAWKLAGNSGTNTSTNYIGTADNRGLKIKTNNSVRIFIKADGDVGIGTTLPEAKLDVKGVAKTDELLVGTSTGATGYIASIGGKLIAEEVRVDLEAVWPDYVFSEKHILMPLDELQQWLADHKHLPGIPDAAEMKNNGIMLGEMQTKSMEKIEEAMLYILELNKENHLLKEQIEKLQQQVSQISKESQGKN